MTKFIFTLLFLIGLLCFFPQISQAQSSNCGSSGSGGSGVSSNFLFCRPTDVPNPGIKLPNLIGKFGNSNTLIQDILNFIVNLLLLIGGLVAFFYVLYGGFKYLMSGPNPQGTEQGKKMIIGGIIGILIMALAYIVVVYIAKQIIPTL